MSHGAAAEPACVAPLPSVTTTRLLPEPVIDNTLTQPQLQRVAPHHHAGRSLGLYRGSFDGHFSAAIETDHAGGETCLRVSRMTLQIEIRDRRIWVIRERKPGTCEYDAVLTHERRHQGVDEAVVDAFVPRLEAAMAQRAEALTATPVAADRREARQRRIMAALNETFRAMLDALMAERGRRQAAVDTPAEYRRIAAACDPMRDKR